MLLISLVYFVLYFNGIRLMTTMRGFTHRRWAIYTKMLGCAQRNRRTKEEEKKIIKKIKLKHFFFIFLYLINCKQRGLPGTNYSHLQPLEAMNKVTFSYWNVRYLKMFFRNFLISKSNIMNFTKKNSDLLWVRAMRNWVHWYLQKHF